ncbi:MAG: ribonuclease H-like domain-containing protein [Patescibacteria group bacterium]
MSINQQKLVFDIETIGLDFETFNKTSQKYLIKFAEDETDKGAVYLRTNDKQLTTNNLEEGITIETGDEKEILEKFWEIAKKYNYFISFNGRGFDVPFLMSNRYLSLQKYDAVHVDLFDQLNFYGAVWKKFNLHM